ncbi:hypothetical protein [Achromobacter kerstersii]|uniref:hypothetical protein n=1 Tax=Achromobacter kerstersii TaxID=1353890 RepID=UPI0006BF235A|nr:hypothetical protein [Achromobacter kerstersii]CUI90122.1 Uncharacterised protein [Achromobacter kerstersii]
MTTISSLGGVQSVTPLSTDTLISRAASPQVPSIAPASTSVLLGQSPSGASASTYTETGAVNDAVSVVMARNVASRGAGNPFSGVGVALLSRFRTEGGNYSQWAPARQDVQAQGVSGTASAASLQATNTVSLQMTTASGAKVDITLKSGAEGMAVQIDVTEGALTEDERNAIANLSGAFQDALDGLAQVPPRLALAGLADMDTSLLSSVNLRATTQANGLAVQTIEFLADSTQRSLMVSGPDGDIKVSADLTKAATFGTAEQQAAAVNKYLQQFDAARSRGDGDAALMSLFKDAFATVHSSYGAAQAQRSQPEGTVVRVPSSDAHRSLLSGLADFSASIKQVTQAINPGRREEVDGFSFQVSQNSRVAGQARWNQVVSQDQQSSLKASFHRSLTPDVKLALTTDKSSQNYLYYQIDDTTRSQTDLRFERGVLASATLSQTRNLSMQVSKYVQGELVDHTVNPTVDSFTRDLLPLFKAANLDEPDKNSRDPRDQVDALMRRRYLDLAEAVAALRQG